MACPVHVSLDSMFFSASLKFRIAEMSSLTSNHPQKERFGLISDEDNEISDNRQTKSRL